MVEFLIANPPYIPQARLPAHLQALIDLLPLNVPIHRTQLEASYGKSNYARRIRKIVAEYGWIIDRERRGNGANDDWYIRRSVGPVRPAFIRREVPPRLRRVVYDGNAWVCQMCGVDVGEDQDLTKAQCDHKIPAERGGLSALQNLQTLCLHCNLKKRQACKHCDLPSCDNCPYAFPERFEDLLVLRLPKDAAKKLVELADAQGVPPATIVTRLIEQS